MGSRLPVRARVRTPHMGCGWLGVATVASVYLLMRYGIDTRQSFVVAQLVYVGTILAAAILLAVGAGRSPIASRTRRSWQLLAASATFVLIGELAFSLAAVLGFERLPDWMMVFDLANAGAALALFAALAVSSAISRFGWRRAVRIVLDGTALVTLVFGVLYRFWSQRLLADPGDPTSAARLAAYGVIALLVFAGGVATFGRPGARDLLHNRLVTVALAFLATGIALWAGTQLALGSGGELLVGVSNTLMLVSYAVMALAGFARITEASMPAAAPLTKPVAWPGVAASVLVFVSVVWLGVLAVRAEQGSAAEAVYLAAVSVAAVCVVGRTYLAYAEADELDRRSLSDPVTGARGPRAFRRESEALVSACDHESAMLCIIDLDLDDFSRINATSGYRVGDRLMTAVARALEAAVGGPTGVFRMRGDEFVVVKEVRSPEHSMALARSLLAAVRAADADSSLTASVGVAVCPADGEDVDALLRHARLARVWSKRHGKNRAVRFEARIGSVLSAQDPFAHSGERVKVDMARALLAATDARDPANNTHARNVAALARLLVEDLGFQPEHANRVEMAAILHDVGKIALPDVMLGGRTLTFRERPAAREHSALGERLIDSLAVEGVGRWVRAHHESWDGSGYPDGLSGDEIPLEARVITLADAYDGMTMGKRYGAPMSQGAALQEIDLGMGARFDPELAERFIRLVSTTSALAWSDEWGAA